MYLAQRSVLFPGASGGPPPPAAWGEPVEIFTPDGIRLHARHSRGAEGEASVLFFHGNADRIVHYGFLAEGLAARGIGLLAVSYRGFPGSTGRPSEAGLLIDGLAAYDWLAARTPGPIVPVGQSLGSGVAVNVAAEREVAGVVLISAYDSVLELARSLYFFLPVAPLIRDPFRSDLRIARVSAPKLFIHGRGDRVIPLARGEALFEIAPEPKRMSIHDGYGHNDLWSPGLVGEISGFVEEVADRQ